MKAAETKISATAARPNTPFFDKESERHFFGKNANVDSFYTKQTAPFIQPKLTIGQPDDPYEREADTMADQVVQQLSNTGTLQAKPLAPLTSISPIVQTKCVACEEEEKLQKKEEVEERQKDKLQKKPIFESNAQPPDDDLQRKCTACNQEEKLQTKGDSYSSQTASSSIEGRLASTKGAGSSLPNNTRQQMESSLGADFSKVRIHSDNSAVQMSKDLHAQAFTHGSDIYFNEGKYDTNSKGGNHLLAHELTHVVQQKSTINKSIQKQPNTKQPITVTPIKPSNTISSNKSTQTLTGTVDPRSEQDPNTYLPFDTSTKVWEKYLMDADNSLKTIGDRKSRHQINAPTKSLSGKDLENAVSFVTEIEGKGSSGSITTNTELKALYDFNTYKWIPYNEGIKLPDPPSYGRKAYPVEVTYHQTIEYSDSKGRNVTIKVFGIVHFTPQRWEDLLKFNTGQLPPPRLLMMKGDFGSYHWTLKGKGPMQSYSFEHLGGATANEPNLIDLAKIQPPQMLHDKPLPVPAFVAPYALPGDQFKSINDYLDAADKIETDYRKWLETLPKTPQGSKGGGTTGTSSGFKLPTWLAGILIGVGIIVGTILAVVLIAEIIVVAAAFAGITLTVGAVIKTLALIGLGISFIRALYSRIKEAMQHGNVSPFKVLGAVLLDTFGISLIIEAITDKSLLTGDPLNRSMLDRWTAGTLGVITTILSFLGLRSWLKGKRTPAPSANNAIGASGNTYKTKSMLPDYVGEETGTHWGGSKVKYLSEPERSQLEVFVSNGQLVDKAGKLVDTSTASSVFSGGSGKAIYVMDESGRIFISHFQAVGKFHHSSILAGKPVAAAGEMVVSNGKIIEISARSGHYKPTQSLIGQVITELAARGMDTTGISVTKGF